MNRFWKSTGKTSCSGFTLLEVMVAVAIIALSFTSLLGSQSQSISYAATARFETVASLLARQKLSQIYIEGFDELSAGDGDFGDDFAGYHWQTEVEDLTEDDTGLPGVEDMLKLVTLTVSRGEIEDMAFQVRAVVMDRIKEK